MTLSGCELVKLEAHSELRGFARAVVELTQMTPDDCLRELEARWPEIASDIRQRIFEDVAGRYVRQG